MRLALRGTAPRWLTPVLLLITVVVTFAIRAAGAAPGAAYERYVLTPLSSPASFYEVLLAATPLLFTGLAVAIAFRSGYYNIGAEGQFLAGAMGATAVALAWPDLPRGIALPVAFVAGAAGGALWALIPALLRVKLDIDEVVTTLLLNPVALLLLQGMLNGPWRNPVNQFPESQAFSGSYVLPSVIPGARVHLGFVIALALAVLAWLVISRTSTGLRMRAVGLAAPAARFSGVSVQRTLLGSALASGAIAGLGGMSQVCGLQGQLTGEISSNFGYTGIVVATLGGLTALGVVLVAVLLADITVGAESAARVLQLPPQMGQVLTAVLLLVTVSLLVFRRYRLVLRPSRPPASTRQPSTPTAEHAGVSP
jgi:simple sugar transport system permease protein